MTSQTRTRSVKSKNRFFVLLGVLITVTAIVAAPVYSGRSTSFQRDAVKGGAAAPADSSTFGSSLPRSAWTSLRTALLPTPLPPAPGITTYAANCTTLKSSFNLGETVCAKITGADQPVNGRASTRIGWVSPYNSVTQGANITTDPQTGFYLIPATPTQTLTDVGGGEVIVDNRGVWTLGVYSALDGSRIQTVNFTVHDPVKEFVDLTITQKTTEDEGGTGAGSGNVFRIFITNRGPDTAHDVVVSDTVPTNTTFTSAIETTSPSLGFTCGIPDGGVFTCTIASLAAGATASFTFAYDVSSGAAEGDAIINNASIASSDTPCALPTPSPCEIAPADNTSTGISQVPVASGTETCTLLCHANFSVVANTTQSGNPGAIVNFGAASPAGNCGAITATFPGLPSGEPASGAFYPVGTTVVSVTSATGGGNCSFTITVVEGTPPTISCPADKTAAADGGGTYTFTAPLTQIGTPTSNPIGLPATFVRSDDIPATYDDQGDVLIPAVVHSLADPFPTGVTGINWTVTDANGLTASCTQRITVTAPCASDVEPPTITAPADVNVGTGPNSTTCGVALSPSDGSLGEPVVNDDCSATVTITGVPAGNLFPVGTTTTLTYTATDLAGRTASDTQTVTVFDNTVPVIFAPPNASYTCPEQVPALSASQAFGPDVNGDPDPTKPVFDNCGSSAVTASQTTSGVGSAASPRIIVRTYTALDTHGNSASAVQTITVTDNTPPTITAPPNVTASTGPGATTCDTVISNATLGTASANDNCAGVAVTRSPSGNTFPVGTTTVTWTATDWAGNTATATQTVTVVDNTVPVITVNGTAPSMWPPNHKYQTFQLTGFVTGASDNCGGVNISNVVIEKVTSDETENGNGDGNTSNDIIIAANCKSVQLRSERDGGGNGRVYTITFKVTDTHGNVGRATKKVVVPHNQGSTPIDSGVNYTVNGTCP